MRCETGAKADIVTTTAKGVKMSVTLANGKV
jgi:hypothetical protein